MKHRGSQSVRASYRAAKFVCAGGDGHYETTGRARQIRWPTSLPVDVLVVGAMAPANAPPQPRMWVGAVARLESGTIFLVEKSKTAPIVA